MRRHKKGSHDARRAPDGGLDGQGAYAGTQASRRLLPGGKLSGEGSPANIVSWSMSANAPSPAPRKQPHRSPTKI